MGIKVDFVKFKAKKIEPLDSNIKKQVAFEVVEESCITNVSKENVHLLKSLYGNTTGFFKNIRIERIALLLQGGKRIL